MSSWMNDAAAVPNHNGAGFNQLNDPNLGGTIMDPSAFMANNNAAFDAQFQSQQMQQRMQNGGMRNASPAFNNPVYQTNPVVPSKRPRPREDSLGTSPRQTPGMLPISRSQTPQQQAGYPGFQPSHTPQPNPYSHLQHNGSGNASPSPIMSNQLRPGAPPQRVSTASPHPFSPAGPQFGAQPSPSQSEHGSRVDTPQNNPYMQNPGFAQNYGQNFTPPPNRQTPHPVTMAPSQMQQPNMQQQSQMFPQQPGAAQGQRQPPSAEQQKMVYQMRMQQQRMQQQQQHQQQMQSNMMAAQAAQGQQRMPNMQQMNAMGKPPMAAPNGQQAFGMGPQQQTQQPGPRAAPNPEAFMKNLTIFMQSRGLPLETNPIVCDRPINLVNLYMVVTKFGGYKRTSDQNLWPQVTQALQINPAANQGAPQQLKAVYERNLMMFEEVLLGQQRQKMQQAQAGNMAGGHPQMSPTKQMNPQAMQQSPTYMQQQAQRQPGQQMMHQQQQQQQPLATPTKQMGPATHPQQAAVNGFSTPQNPQSTPQTANAHHPRSSRSVDGTSGPNGTAYAMASPVSASKQGGLAMQSSHPDADLKASMAQVPEVVTLDTEFNPRVREMDSWGGINCDALEKLGTQLTLHKPNVPSVAEMGMVDLHALTMSIQSGIHAEVRVALDTLATLSVEPRLQLDLRACDDLVDTLIDCAEAQIDELAEHAAEVSDDIQVPSYEDVIRGCRIECDILPDIPEFGSLDYDLDRAADRLICVTTILRNLSFYETNHPLLADELVIKLLCLIIRSIGTRTMLLRTHLNTLDIMKDLIILLSNIAHSTELPSREQAECLLQFLLSFAPCPTPNLRSDRILFTSYDPAIHRYLPAAVDSLAKLLARDEPNRTFYKAIFVADSTSTPPFDLLTKTFGLAISPLPSQKIDKRGALTAVVEARKPYLMQGLLAADILSNLAPGPESNLARSWLKSEDGFAQTLYKLVVILCAEPPPQIQQHGRGGAAAAARVPEDEALQHIILGGLTVLRRLAEKSFNPEDKKSSVPFDGLPTKESVLGALLAHFPRTDMNREVLKQLCSYAALEF